MKIFCCQMDIAWENKATNFAKAQTLIAEAKVPAGSLVVLPEMFATGFSMDVAAIAESASANPAPGSRNGKEFNASETADFLAGTARKFNIYLVGGLVTVASGARGRNQAAVFSPEGKEIARYSKCQPFTLGGESQHYEAGKEIVTFKWHDCVVAPFICYDLRFPELFRAAVRRGAELFVVIASWPVKRIHHWSVLLQARAIENLACVAGVNRTGTDPKFTYTGRSVIVNAHGDVLAEAGDAEGAISAEVDLADLRSWRAEFPALQDMRAGASQII